MKHNKGKNINFYARYYKNLKKEKKIISARRKLLIPLVVLVIVFGVIFTMLQIDNFKKTSELDTLLRDIDNSMEKYMQVSQLKTQRDQLSIVKLSLEEEKKYDSFFPSIDSDIFYLIQNSAGDLFNIDAYRYDEENYTIQIQAVTKSVNNVPELVERIRNTGRFISIDYAGYSSDSDGLYYCTIGCALNPFEKIK